MTNRILLAFIAIILPPVLGKGLERPNILFLVSDDHSAAFVGCYGNEDVKTPNLDNLAAEGIRFNHAYTTASQCVPSRASLITSRNVVDIRMLRFSAPLDKNIITFPELLREAGYYTGIGGRGHHLDGSGAKAPETIDAFEEFEMVTIPDRFDYLQGGSDNRVLEVITEFLDEVPEGKPFFMWANYSDPHRPYTASDFEPDPETITVPEGMPDTRLLREDLVGHLGEVNRLDYHIGQVFEELKDRGLYDNTLIVFIGDHGSPVLRGKGTLYQQGLHVPLIARYPGIIEPGTVSNILVSGKDIGLTMLDLAGVEPDREMTGKSFKHAFQGDETENHEYLFAARGSHASGLPVNSAMFDMSRSVFNQEYRLIYNAMWQLPYTPVDFWLEPFWRELRRLHEDGELEERFSGTAIFTEQRPMFEFFDLRNDPHEFVNLSGRDEYEELEREFKAQLHRWMIIYRDSIPLPIPPGPRN